MLTFKFNGRKNEYGEYVVKCWDNGERYPEGDYLTNDKNDAEGTCRLLNKANSEQLQPNM